MITKVITSGSPKRREASHNGVSSHTKKKMLATNCHNNLTVSYGVDLANRLRAGQLSTYSDQTNDQMTRESGIDSQQEWRLLFLKPLLSRLRDPPILCFGIHNDMFISLIQGTSHV